MLINKSELHDRWGSPELREVLTEIDESSWENFMEANQQLDLGATLRSLQVEIDELVTPHDIYLYPEGVLVKEWGGILTIEQSYIDELFQAKQSVSSEFEFFKLMAPATLGNGHYMLMNLDFTLNQRSKQHDLQIITIINLITQKRQVRLFSGSVIVVSKAHNTYLWLEGIFPWVKIKFSFKKGFHGRIFLVDLAASNVVGVHCIN